MTGHTLFLAYFLVIFI